MVMVETKIEEYPCTVWMVNSHGEVVAVVVYTAVDYYVARAGRTPLSVRDSDHGGKSQLRE